MRSLFSSASWLVGVVTAFTFSAATGCAPANQAPDSEDLVEDATATGEGLSGSIPVGTSLQATGNVNLRTSASTSSSVLHVVAAGSIVTVQASSPVNGYYKVKHNGSVGWSYGKYLEPAGGAPDEAQAGSTLAATGDVNLRSGPSTSYSILRW